MSGGQERLDAAVLKYVNGYLQRELIQGVEGADVDPQLATAVMMLNERLADHPGGRLFDLGCGHGSLLARLATVPAFVNNPDWRYAPVDFEDKIDEVGKLARKLKLLKRMEPLTIEEFGSEAADADPKIFFCRNVFHELKLGEAAQLVHSVCRLFGPDDLFFVQDLLRFPEGERNNHCWTADQLAQALESIGFSSVTELSQGTKSGNAWFNLTAKRFTGNPPSVERIYAALFEARKAQWLIWSAVETAGSSLPARGELIEAIDMALQLASLTRELRSAGGLDLKLDPEVERTIRANEIVKRIEGLADLDGLVGSTLVAPAHFRERGAQLTIAEDFLRSGSRLAVVHGGKGTGKTTFIEQLLANRLYDKTLVVIDARAARGVWPMLEQLMSQLGVNLAADVISVMEHLTYGQIAPSVGRLLNRFSSRLVVVFENIDEVLDSNQRFIDPQIESFLTQFIAKEGIKVILSSKREFLPATIQRAAGNQLAPSIAMGRYATSATVANVLDDYFDRGRAGLADYPASLIDAIDRHPLVAELAGRILEQDGQDVLLDQRFFEQLRKRLRDDLVARLVDEPSEAAMEVAAELRTPVPAQTLEFLAGRESVHHARTNEVIYAVPDRRWSELLTSLGLFRKRAGNDLMPASEHDVSESGGVSHARIADALEQLYREDDDPKWIRESYYHRMLSGQTEGLSLTEFAGSYYLTELVASANYCFEKRSDYEIALSLYDAAATLGTLDESSLMRRASCLVRTGNVKNGNTEYRRLIADFPNNVGMRRSHVDALLYRREFKLARTMLQEHGLLPEQNNWHALQWGRTELGLHNYGSAIDIFRALREKTPDDPFVVTYMARALQQFGDLDLAIEVLEKGITDFPDNVAIRTSLGNNLERAKRDDEAVPLLRGLVSDDAGNARAALSLVRILLRTDAANEAAKVAKAASRKARGGLKIFAIMSTAEVMSAKDDWLGAAELLRNHLEEDEGIGALLIDALLRGAERAETLAERDALIAQAAAVPISIMLVHNVPVQVVLVRLALARRDRTAFDTAIGNLARTRIEHTELQRLRALW
jgi:tetratricopeptide (TPR) repeat protein